MKYKAAIFDMDGTILDTIEDIADSVNFSLRKFDFPERSFEEIRGFVGNGIHRTLEKSVPEGTDGHIVDELFDCYNEHYKENCTIKTKPYAGITEVIKELKKAGIYTAVVSNKEDREVQILKDKFFDGLFDYAVGNSKKIRRKPYPDSTLEVLRKFGISGREALYVGDSEVDYETCQNAGVDSALVAWGFREEGFLRQIGSKYFIQRPEEILEIVLKK